MKNKNLIEEIKGKKYSYKEKSINFIFKGKEISEGYLRPDECPFCGSKQLKRGLGKDYKKMKSADKWGSICCANSKCSRTIFIIYREWTDQYSDTLRKDEIKKLKQLFQ